MYPSEIACLSANTRSSMIQCLIKSNLDSYLCKHWFLIIWLASKGDHYRSLYTSHSSVPLYYGYTHTGHLPGKFTQVEFTEKPLTQ